MVEGLDFSELNIGVVPFIKNLIISDQRVTLSVEIETMQPYQALFRKKARAYTLTEILVVLVIIGILTLLALPNLLPTINRAKAVEAKNQLKYLQSLEKSYFYEHSNYTTDFNELGFIQSKLSTDGGNANYRIEITSATNTTFTARATAVKDFNGNGTYDTWEIDQDGNPKEISH